MACSLFLSVLFFLCLRASCLFQAGRQAGVPLKQDHSCGTGGKQGRGTEAGA